REWRGGGAGAGGGLAAAAPAAGGEDEAGGHVGRGPLERAREQRLQRRAGGDRLGPVGLLRAALPRLGARLDEVLLDAGRRRRVGRRLAPGHEVAGGEDLTRVAAHQRERRRRGRVERLLGEQLGAEAGGLEHVAQA